MPATLPENFAFVPKVWSDHSRAYFRRKLVLGAFAVMDDTLKAAPGETINFPFFSKIGDAEEPAATDALSVDSLSDDSFSASVFEVGKAVGIRKKALYTSAARQERIMQEINEQIGRVHAEKLDKKLLAEIQTVGNYSTGYTAALAADTCNVRSINQGKIVAFGDLHTESSVLLIHSLCELDLLNDSTAGFLKADANDPMWGRPGFVGRLLGMAVFTYDSLARVADVGGKQAYESFILKPNAYGVMHKQDMEMESDYDILNREWVFTGNEWYAVKAFHAKISADDKRIARMTFATSQNA